MTQMEQPDRFVTPEALALDIDVAGLGSRFIAISIDSLIQLVPLWLVASAIDHTSFAEMTKVGIMAFLSFVTFWVYFAAFEIAWDGQTPGKRAQRLRVVSADGRTASARQSMLRNLVRGVDFLPLLYLVGVTTMLITSRSQRLGDIAGGTLVRRERKEQAPQQLFLQPAPTAASGMATGGLDTSGLNAQELQAVRSFLLRRDGLDGSSRSTLAAQLTGALAPKVPGSATWRSGNEAFLEEIVRSRSGA